MVTYEGEAIQSIAAVLSSGNQQEASDSLYRIKATTPQWSLTYEHLNMAVREEALQVQNPCIEGGEVFVGKEIDIEEKMITVTIQREDVVIALAGSETIRLPIAGREPVNIERGHAPGIPTGSRKAGESEP